MHLLADELIERCLEFLWIADLSSASKTSRALATVATHSVQLWRALAMQGWKLGLAAPVPAVLAVDGMAAFGKLSAAATARLVFARLAPRWPSHLDLRALDNAIAAARGRQRDGDGAETHRVAVPAASATARGATPGCARARAAVLQVAFDGDALGGDRCVRADAPFPPVACAPFAAARGARLGLHLTAYFEATVGTPRAARRAQETAPGAAPCCTIGLAFAEFPLVDMMPGWDRRSFGFHGDDGRIYHDDLYHGHAWGAPFGTGDVIGCGIVHGPPPAGTRRGGAWSGIFFTLNGVAVGPAAAAPPGDDDAGSGLPPLAFVFVERGAPDAILALSAQRRRPFMARGRAPALFPVVGLDSYCPVSLNFGDKPFAFDIDALERAAWDWRRRVRDEGHFAGHDPARPDTPQQRAQADFSSLAASARWVAASYAPETGPVA